MELVKEDGSVIELREGQKLQLGRASGPSMRDESVSRVHVVVEPLRPPSIKGKEVIGKSVAPKLHVQVLGRNPICIIVTQGNDSPTIKFAGRGEEEWLASGDKLSLSIKQPLFFSLRSSSLGTVRPDWESPSLRDSSSGDLAIDDDFPIPGSRTDADSSNPSLHGKDHNSNLKSEPLKKDAATGKVSLLEEEEGIASAVARRERRRLDRDKEENRKREEEQRRRQQPQQVQGSDFPSGERHVEAPALSAQARNASASINPVSEFGFVVKGSEFLSYEKQKQTVWRWKIEKKGDSEEDNFNDDEVMGAKSNKKASAKKILLSEEDEEWGGDSKEDEEHLAKVLNKRDSSKVSTRATSDPSDKKRGGLPAPDANKSKDLSDFIVDDEDPIEDIEEEEEEEWMDEDQEILRQPQKGNTKQPSKKPVCKYGSSCYRKNKEHLTQFYHPGK